MLQHTLLLASAVLSSAVAHADVRRLSNPQPGLDEYFGFALATSGRWMLVGVPDDVNVGGTRTGSVVVFELIDGQYVEHSRLFAADGAANDAFGHAVAVDDNVAVVGAWNDSLPAGSGAGSAYVYNFSGVGWVAGEKLTAPDAATSDGFGASLSLDDDVLLVGAPFDDLPSLADAGSAHLFVRNGGWSHATTLVAPDATAFDGFGFAVAADGDELLVGARDADAGAGAVYAFDRNGSLADFLHRMIAADRGASDRFGAALSIAGDTVLIGAAQHANEAGAAYVFQRVGNTWTQQHKLVAPGTTAQDRAGQSVALRSDLAVLGVPGATLGACCQQGAVDLFVRNGNRWRFERRLRADDSEAFDQLGSAVALSVAGALAGAPMSRDRIANFRDAGTVVHFSEDWSFFRDSFETSP